MIGHDRPCDRDWPDALTPRGTDMAKDTTANWQVVDTNSLPSTISALYHDYKAAYAEMKREREEFEAALREAVPTPDGKRLAIAYNFGKLSVAMVDDDKKASTAKGSVALSDLIRR